MRLCLTALDDLRKLDDSLYDRFVASRGGQRADDAATLRALWAETFRGLGPLLAFCQREVAARLTGEVTELVQADGDDSPYAMATIIDGDEGDDDASPSAGAGAAATGDDLDFDFGDLDGGDDGGARPGPNRDDLEIGTADIGDLLENIDGASSQSDSQRWATVVDKMSSIEYGLRTQHDEAFRQMLAALEAGQVGAVLAVFDDTQSSISEGVHALVSAVYETFVPSADPATVVPGYLTSLGRALLVRRGIADLAGQLAPHNQVLADPKAADAEAALTSVRELVHRFVGSVVCRAMRAADRWQMVEFDRELAAAPLAGGRLTSEGLVKYLESLSSVNQREVLILHDQRVTSEVRETLASARELFDLSPRTAVEMLARARVAAARLRGRHPASDEVLRAVDALPDGAEADGRALLRLLDDLLELLG